MSGAPFSFETRERDTVDAVDELHKTLDERPTPEAVCAIILRANGARMLSAQRRHLHRAASSTAAYYTSTSDDFERPVAAVHKVRMLMTLVGKTVSEQAMTEMAHDPWKLNNNLAFLAPFVGWNPDADFKHRMNRAERVAAGVKRSGRQYNRIVRHMMRTRARAVALQRQILLRQLQLVGRSGMAYAITAEQMRADVDAACFVAYWTAQRNRRRAFSLEGRDNAMDVVAQMLLARCQHRGASTDWAMIAKVHPAPEILARLDDVQVADLMGRWFQFMRVGADLLKGLYDAWPTRVIPPVVPDDMWAARPGLMPSAEQRGGRTVKGVNLETMAVAPGVDSSTWNTVASAYNAARAGWLNCLDAAGALDLLDGVCPGKAMRLIAADLARWHRLAGGGPDPQTQVWAALPLPWQVFAGEECPADYVESTCWRFDVDPHATGWTRPAPARPVAAWKPTPELVHGVECADPLWAGLLRRAGVFSGDPGPDAGQLHDAYREDQAAVNG